MNWINLALWKKIHYIFPVLIPRWAGENLVRLVGTSLKISLRTISVGVFQYHWYEQHFIRKEVQQQQGAVLKDTLHCSSCSITEFTSGSHYQMGPLWKWRSAAYRRAMTSLSTHSVQFSCSVVSDFLRRHGLQHTRLPCPSPTPRACSNSCPSSQWYHLTISSSLSPSPPAFNLSQHWVFSNESALCIRWPKYWSFSFSISPSNEYSALISFMIDQFDFLAVLLCIHRSNKPHVICITI